ncbi:response regulator [Bacillus sp. CRN 9]|uniref:response regulator transcription factor n=1 Tax=Cytobacillus horneckiae TaxID=549687 RepID=UPI0015622AED|nr:response regulator [Bacillus sp. CRN 9]
MYNLIIADDEYEIRHGLSNYFPWESVGFKVIASVSDGKEVLNMVSKLEIDVVLCDIRMPGMTGIEVAEELYRMNESVFIVFLSGYKDFTYAQKAIEYGVKNYIVKPTKFSELLNVFTKIKIELDQIKVELLPVKQSTFNKSSEKAVDPVIVKIKDYVIHNFNHATLEKAAKTVYMNPHYVSKYFKQKTGKNFSEYLIEIKMEEAAKLLMDLKYKTYEVSEMVGYTNSKNFTRAFSKFFGLTPKEYRRREYRNL